MEIQDSSAEEVELVQFTGLAGCFVLYIWVELWSTSGGVTKSVVDSRYLVVWVLFRKSHFL